MIALLVRVAFDAIFGAWAVWLLVVCIWPQLLMRRARWPAFAFAAAIAATVPLSLALSSALPVPSYVVSLAAVLLISFWFWPDALVRLTGGQRPLPTDVQPVFSAVTRAWERFEVGDLDGARGEVEGLDRLRTLATARYIDLWRRWIDEEMARRSGTHQSSRETMREIQTEAARLIAPRRRPGMLLTSLLLAVAAIIGATPALADARACIGVEMLLFSQTNNGPAHPPSLGSVLVTDTEPRAALLYDSEMDLNAAAESRHDPDTRAQLIAAGFVAAYAREWQAPDGRLIQADVFEFRDPAGALSFHRTVNRHACRFSNEAFRGPSGSVGLQVRWSRGDAIEEQISWVVGSRRFVISVSALAPPANHDRVLSLAKRQADRALH